MRSNPKNKIRSREKSLLLLYFIQVDAIANLEYQLDDPNDRNYDSIKIGTLSSISDVDTFFSRFNHSNGYKDGSTKLRIGNFVTIQDGTYNSVWEIAGFDMEHNQEAADGTIYDNGYGICMIPQYYMGTTGQWNTSNTLAGAYKSSHIHTTVLPGIVTTLQNVLGSHIVNRNVLLSSGVDANHNSNAYTWTTAYATLMSVGQIVSSGGSKYDNGEANYKLPIFNSKECGIGVDFWLRNVWGYDYGCRAVRVDSNGKIIQTDVTNAIGIRPLIYLR